MVQGLVDAAVDRMAAADGPVDVIDELAFPLPFDVISEMLGMPETDKLQIRDWSEALVKTLDAMLSDDDVRAAIRANRAMDAYIDGVIEWKRDNPADDLLTLLIDAEHEGDRLTPDELRDQVASAVRRRARDHRQPDRHRHPRAAPPPRPGPALARRCRAGRTGGRGAAALRRARCSSRGASPPRTSLSATARSRRAAS